MVALRIGFRRLMFRSGATKRHAEGQEGLTYVRKVCIIKVLTKVVNKKRGNKMKTEAKFIRRRIVVGLVFLGLVAWAFDATTPEMCKVPTEQMNQFCLDLMYP